MESTQIVVVWVYVYQNVYEVIFLVNGNALAHEDVLINRDTDCCWSAYHGVSPMEATHLVVVGVYLVLSVKLLLFHDCLHSAELAILPC